MNNLLLTIFYSFIVFLSQIVIFYIFNQFSKEPIKMKKILIPIIIIGSLVETFLTTYLSPVYNCIICISYFLIILKIFTTIKFKDIIFYSINIWLLLIFLDIFTMLIYNALQLIFPVLSNYVFVARPVGTIIMNVAAIIITKQKIIHKFINNTYNYFQKIDSSIVYILLLFTLYYMLGALSISHIRNLKLLIIIFLLAIILTITIIKILLSKYEIITLKTTNQLLIKNNEFYLKLLDDYHILKHNLISQLLGIKSIANNKAKKLIDELIKEYNANFQTTSDLRDVPSGLNGIIYEKVYNFNKKELNILIDNKIASKVLEVITPRSYNLLCEALGVVLDNALEAAYKSKDKVVYLNFREMQENIKVTIINTFSGIIDLEKLGQKNYTTKNIGHGIGLYSIIGRRKIKMKTTIKNNLFINEILIEKKK